MKQRIKKHGEIAVIVGRFQSPELSAGHKNLIETAAKENDFLICFIGVTPVKMDPHDPLSYEIREHMVHQYLDELVDDGRFRLNSYVVDSKNDMASDEIWSADLDDKILDIIQCSGINGSVKLYGGRDSFVKSYHGDYEYKEVKEVPGSATDVRNMIMEASHEEMIEKIVAGIKRINGHNAVPTWLNSCVEYSINAGIIKASSFQYPTSFQCIDCIVIDEDDRVLLGKKEGSDAWHLPGGFVDVADQSLEEAAYRELMEETGLQPGLGGYHNMTYLKSDRVQDYRYRKRRDAVMTTYFVFSEVNPELLLTAKAGDDLIDLQWFHISELPKMLPSHLDAVLSLDQ